MVANRLSGWNSSCGGANSMRVLALNVRGLAKIWTQINAKSYNWVQNQKLYMPAKLPANPSNCITNS